ncbi:hypothetical protein [Sphaerisporangium perillae]|uniref:hypothetical protein n=1 Tax=Sphaerisporangium perillae TaxID=2935860 RepID=UPI00200CCDA7|nr:hypothetical protein [Sphaerisporangium perillae]
MPELEADITPDELEKDVRDELRSLPNDLASMIACHLVAAERALGEDDAARAYEHAKVARRFAARIGVVREAVGLAAYRAGHYAEALSDLRAARRMTGSDEFLPIMADCERGLGRPERALDLVRSPEAERLDRAGRIELAIVESGARRDLGQHDAAVITLQRVPELRNQEPHPWSARLAFAYADALAEAGHESAATDWFERAMMFDEDGETDAAERYAELTGAVIEDIEEDIDEDEDEDEFGEDAGEDTGAVTSKVLEQDDLDQDELDELDQDDEDELDDDDDDDEDEDDEDEDDEDDEDEDDELDELDEELGRDGFESAVGTPEAVVVEPVGAQPDVHADAEGRHDVAPEASGTGGEADDVDPEGAVADLDDIEPEATAAEPGAATAEPDPDVAAEREIAAAVEPPAAPVEAVRPEPGMAPAFIEPDFGVSARAVPGDVLDDDDDDDAEARKHGKREA